MKLSRRRVLGRTLLAGIVGATTLTVAGAGPSGVLEATDHTPIIDDPACTANVLPANDDGSSQLADLGFEIRFGDLTTSTAYVNNNGNITFDQPLSAYTPTALSNIDTPIIAPFWADVDTRNSASEPVRFGWGTTVYDGQPAFCVNWYDVGYYSSAADKLNRFQLLLVDRDEGNFDAVFNYELIEWETGRASGGTNGLGGNSARAGFSSGNDWYEIVGSGIPGSFLDNGFAPLRTRGTMTSEFFPGRFELLFYEGELLRGLLLEGGQQLPLETTSMDQMIGSRAELTFIGTVPPLIFPRGEVVSGPNVGTEVGCLDQCWDLTLGYRGTEVGTDLVAVWIDEDFSGGFDPWEPRTFIEVRWWEQPQVAALGDSYSSGEGLEGSGDGGYLGGFGDLQACHRADRAWPAILELYDNYQALDNSDFNFIACTGATTYTVHRTAANLDDISARELANADGPAPAVRTGQVQGDYLVQAGGADPIDLVTLTIGGNDAEWTTVLKECINQTDVENCFDGTLDFPGTEMTLREWADYRLSIIPTRLRQTLADIKSAAPEATVVLAGYPVFAPPAERDCTVNALVGGLTGKKLTPAEFAVFRELQLLFEPEIAAAAADARVHYVSVADEFAGHEICGEDGQWVNDLDLNWHWTGLPTPETKSFHPTATGHRAYARVIENYITNLSQTGWELTDSGLPVNPRGGFGPLFQAASFAAAAAATSVPDAVAVRLDSPSRACGTGAGIVLRPGDTVTAIAAGLAPGSAASATISSPDSPVEVVTDTTVAPDGSIAAPITLPADLPTGIEWYVSLSALLDDRGAFGIEGPYPSSAGAAPCMEDDVATTGLDAPVGVAVLDNDDDGGTPFDPATLVAAAVDGGTVAVDSAGIVTYTPPRGFVGRVEVRYSVCRTDELCFGASLFVDVDPGCTIVGTPGDDDLVGTPGPDVICGLGGDDVIYGRDGDDTIIGGPGDDYLIGEGGRDRIIGGDGRNYYRLDGGDDADVEDGDRVVGGDTTPPTIEIVTPAAGTYVLHESVVVDYSCDDDSAVATCEGDVPVGDLLDTSVPGEHTFSVTATDEAGNEATEQVTYRVVYVFGGFERPVDDPSTAARAGRTVPLRWTLSSATGPVTTPSAIVSIGSVEVTCDGDEMGELEPADSVGGGLTHLSEGRWKFNWSTSRTWGGTCRNLVIGFADGTTAVALFEFR
ncbi:MAG: hypothetical protein HKN44_01450 [Ilumatobacter sp.]|nr:hypothetical protein [Ilumatobacter sp.]